jgi:hypothetical protein
MHPDAPFIRRVGEVNAFDNPEFRAALKASGRKQVILGALLTEVCRLILVYLSIHDYLGSINFIGTDL